MENQWYMMVKFRVGIKNIYNKESLFKQISRESFRIFLSNLGLLLRSKIYFYYYVSVSHHIKVCLFYHCQAKTQNYQVQILHYW